MSVNGDEADISDSENERRFDTREKETPLSSISCKDVLLDEAVTVNDGRYISGDHYASEVNRLLIKNKQLKLDLQAEQDIVIELRKKLNVADKQKLETATQSNEKIASLETQLAKVHSKIEKGEAARQILEYELAKSQKEVYQIKQVSKNKEDILIEGTDDLKYKISDLSEEVKHLQKCLQSCKENAHSQQDKLKDDIVEKDQQLLKYRTELESVCFERDKLHDLCQQHSIVISRLNDKLQEFEGEKKNVLHGLRHAAAELEYGKDREERIRTDLEASLSRIKTLEESVEAEKTSHLETKFNSEIVLLRVRDLESAIDVEKSGNVEANKAVERLTQQNKELGQVYEEERKSKKELSKKLDKLEKEHVAVKRQLSTEMEDKQAMIENLSKELELHQKNFNDLKSELGKAKKRQQLLEETYGGSIKELELMLQNFHFDDKRLRISRKEDVNDANKGKKAANPTVVVENLKHLLVQLKKRIDFQTEEISKTKKTIERLTKELDSSKELMKIKDKTIEDTHKNYTKTNKDLNKMKSNYVQLESTLGKLKTNLQLNVDSQDKDKTRIQDLSEEIMKLMKKHRSEEEEKVTFLHGLHQKILSCHMTMPSKDIALSPLSWSDLSEAVYEQVSVLIELLQAADEKLSASYKTIHDKQETISALKHEHAEQITKLTNSLQERQATWQQQKEDIEHHYKKMLSDLQSQTKKTQAIANQAWEKVRATGNVQQGLESEVIELRRFLAESQVHASSLLSACALLSGALFPLFIRSLMLTSEIHIFREQYTVWESCRERALYLITVLTSGKGSDQDKPERDKKFQRKIRPILKFRVGAVTVLAANRLLSLGHKSARCFTTYAKIGEERALRIDVGGLELKQRSFKGADRVEDDSFIRTEPQQHLSSWLGSTALLEAVVTSMAELQEFISYNKKASNPGESQALVSATRSSFSQFIDQLSHLFPLSASSAHFSLKDRSPLLRRLGKRLSKTLNDTPVQLKGNFTSSQDLMSTLQNHILDLTQRLHAAEKERRQLLREFNELKQQIEDENNSAQIEAEKINDEGKQAKYIPASKFEQVCVELSNALQREQKAQQLLQEQSKQLMDLTSRLDFCASDGMQKQNSMLQLQECLTETQNDLRHKEQSLRQINIHLGQVQYDRDSLENNLRDAANALKNVARDKEILTQYINNVQGALEMAKKQFSLLQSPWVLSRDVSLPQRLLDSDLIPQDIGNAGPELIALQNLVGSFIDCQHHAESKVRCLQEEVVSHRDHINTLKKELSNAIHREFIERTEDNTNGETTSVTDVNLTGKETFVPLREDPKDISLPKTQPKTLISPPIYQSRQSAFQTVKSTSQYSSKKSK